MFRAVLLLAAGCLTLPTPSSAEEGSTAAAVHVRFSIPAQPLATALIAFGRQANVQVLTAGRTVSGLRSCAVDGTLVPAAALASLLRGTGLRFVFLDAETVAVKRAESVADSNSARAESKSTDTLQPISVLGTRVGGFKVDTSDSATRVDTDMLDLPESVSVVPQDLLDSQQAFRVADAVRNLAGVQYEFGSDALAQLRIRGYFVGNGMTDGLPNNATSYGDLPPLVGIERIEALKGPQAILGDSSVSNNFGGLINIVLKKPLDEAISRAGFLHDGRGDTQVNLDQGGPLGTDSPWTYRLIASGESATRTPQGHVGARNVYVAPSLGWHDADNRLVVGAQALVKHEPLPDYSVLLGASVATATPRGLLIGNPHDHSVFDSTRVNYSFEHDFNADWTLRSRGQYLRQFVGVEDWQFSGFALNGDVAQVLAESYRYTDSFYTLQNDVVGNIGEGAIRHVVVTGFDYSRSLTGINDDYLALWSTPYNPFTSPALPRARPFAMTGTDAFTPAQPWTSDKAWFAQDQVAIGQRWHVLAAVRRWTYPVFTVDANGNSVTTSRTHWVPNLGVLFRWTPGISLYASAINGFQPDEFLGKNGQLLPPSQSRQF
jgi:iron complex outermembrane receptor protein